MYNNVCNKIQNSSDRTNADLRCKSVTPVKNEDEIAPPSTSKSKRNLDSPALRRRNIIDDASDDEIDLSQNVRRELAFPSDDSNDSDEKSNVNIEVSGVKEYRNAMSALRNRNLNDHSEVNTKKTKPKSALLAPEEVDDDWLEDDLGIHKNKKRKLSDPLTIVSKKPSYEQIKESVDSINSIPEPLIENTLKQNRSRIDDVIDIDYISDYDRVDENIRPEASPAKFARNNTRELDFKTNDSRENMRKRWKRQSTLLKSGFQRKLDEDQSSNSGSETEFTRRDSFHARNKSISRHSSAENFNEGFNIMQNINPNIVQPVNVIQPINIVKSTKNGRPVQTQILPPAAVKVHIEDKVLLISLKLDTINRLTISWLVEEVKTRYYK